MYFIVKFLYMRLAYKSARAFDSKRTWEDFVESESKYWKQETGKYVRLGINEIMMKTTTIAIATFLIPITLPIGLLTFISENRVFNIFLCPIIFTIRVVGEMYMKMRRNLLFILS